VNESHHRSQERFRYIEIGETPQPAQHPEPPQAQETAPPEREAVEPEAVVRPAEISIPKFRPFTEQQARTVLTAWFRSTLARRLFAPGNWAKRARLAAVTNQVGYRVRLLTQYETRSLRYEEGRLGPEPIVSMHTVGDLWSYSLPRPTDFVNRTESHPIRGTDQLVDCGQCHGLGLVRCPRCRGRTVLIETGFEGTVGALPCPACRAAGSVPCERCRGQGQLRRYSVLTVRYFFRDSSLVASASAIPDERLRQVRGQPFVTLRQQQKLRPPPINEPLDEAVRLLQEGRTATPGERILFEQLEAEVFPLAQVSLEDGGREPLAFWVYGEERRPYFPPRWRGAAISWGRVFGALLLALGIVAGSIYGCLRFLR